MDRRAQPRTARGNPSGTMASTSAVASRPTPSKAAASGRRSSRDILEWLTVPPVEEPARQPIGFMGCCPCHVTLDERAFTPPWCFTYRYVDWLLTIALVLLAMWGTVYCVVGADVGPGSPFFNSAVVVLAAYFFGWACHYQLNLPAAIGMYTVALVYRNVPSLWNSTAPLDPLLITAAKSLFLTIVFIKAGLYFDSAVFRNFGLTIVLLGCLPCLCEAVAVGLGAYVLLGVSALWAAAIGVMCSGVSPVLLSLALVSLANQGYGNRTGILSILLAATFIDNTLAVMVFSMLSVSEANSDEYGTAVLYSMVKVVLSLSIGCLLGFALAFFPNKHSTHGLLARFALLFLTCCCVNVACHRFLVDTAAFICNATISSVMVNCWRVMEWQEGANPFREVFEMLWQACQPVTLFLVGTSIDFQAMESETVWRVIVLFLIGLLVRCPVTYCLTKFSRKPSRQRLLMSIAWASKGLIQTTLGALALRIVRDDPVLSEKLSTTIALIVLMGCFVITFLLKVFGPRLLPKSA